MCTLIGMMIQKRWFANSALLIITFVWGATFTLTKGALDSLPVFGFLSARFVIATVGLIALVLLTPSARKSFTLRTWGLGTVLGLFLFGAYALQTVGLQYTTPSLAGFLTGLSVVLVPLLGVFLLKQKLRWRTWLGAGTAVVGLGLLCGPGLQQFALGDIYVLLCAVFIALQMLFIEKYGNGTNPLALATVEIAVLTVACLVLELWTDPSPTWVWTTFHNPQVAFAVFICAIPGTALAYWGQNVFQQFTSSAQTAVIFSMEPVFATLVAWMVLGEGLTPLTLLGSILIFTSMLMSDTNLQFNWTRALAQPFKIFFD